MQVLPDDDDEAARAPGFGTDILSGPPAAIELNLEDGVIVGVLSVPYLA